MSARQCPPAASCTLESLRGLGYTLPTAIADLVDNSIAAGATEVDVQVEWHAAQSWICVIDNGRGMNDEALESAMRLGVLDPRAARTPSDLGRFGLGLKTASFSLGRRLTVASKPAGGLVSCLRWDLDLLRNEPGAGWELFEGSADGSHDRIAHAASMPHGTAVLVENLDRVIGDEFRTQDMLNLLDELEAHLAMVFHRMLTPVHPGFCLRLNGRSIPGWDPFLTGHPGKALESPEYTRLNNSTVRVRLHVLPHRDLLTEDEFTKAGGPNGWIEQQGFYVYRNKRLLVAGGWLGLADGGRTWTQDEPHRLARIRLDILNSEDAEWRIDVRKSMARPPARLRRTLVRLGREAREKARRAFAGRGVTIRAETTKERVPDPWNSVRSTSGTSYKIAHDHDLIASLLDRAGPLKPELLVVFKLLEATLPVQRIWIDTAEEKETPRTGFVGSSDDEILDIMRPLFQALIAYSKLSPVEARDRISRTPPFGAYGHLIDSLGPQRIT